ncbi:hypothetical protein NE237_023506 [Protea cynaroides]|uniref:BPL/LPL catalytic domain-containing protein n=1 Tax=Protea cynaroides TaxID=273540 RepID=A0A9Q0HGE9_9MAGN|nr:hypothetical protein NE237_023506 [Protea cynaroides]
MAVIQAKNVAAPLMNIVRFKGMPILEQLHLEERIFRTSSNNWCIINDGTNAPTIVMGVSGKPSELLELKLVLQDKVPVVRRFTGGGTVIVDPGTIFVTFICNKDAVPNVELYPRPIMSWSGQIYEDVFRGIGDFHLRDNDYVFGNRKFGGNAQSISRRRWIHHTSFLWDYDVRNMAYLKVPKRAPEYRSARSHVEFVCRIKDYLSTSDFINRTVKVVRNRFSLAPMQLEEVNIHAKTSFDHSSRLLTKAELEAAFVSENLYREGTGLSQGQFHRKMKDVIRLSNRLNGKPEKEIQDLRRNLFLMLFSFFAGSTFEGAPKEQHALLELEDTVTSRRKLRSAVVVSSAVLPARQRLDFLGW